MSRLLIDEVRRLLEAAGLTVFVGERPVSTVRCVVIDPIPGGLFDGTTDRAGAEEEESPRVQLTTIGEGFEQVCDDAGAARAAVLNVAAYAVPGRTVMQVITEMTGGVEADRDSFPHVWWSTQPFRFFTSAA